jgi:hypothetical protein
MRRAALEHRDGPPVSAHLPLGLRPIGRFVELHLPTRATRPSSAQTSSHLRGKPGIKSEAEFVRKNALETDKDRYCRPEQDSRADQNH